MAFGKRDYRRIVVQDRIFFWFYDCVDPHDRLGLPITRADQVPIRHGVKPHHLLRVHCGIRCPRITPGVVRPWIDTAMSPGWPDERSEVELNGMIDARHTGPRVDLDPSAKKGRYR